MTRKHTRRVASPSLAHNGRGASTRYARARLGEQRRPAEGRAVQRCCCGPAGATHRPERPGGLGDQQRGLPFAAMPGYAATSALDSAMDSKPSPAGKPGGTEVRIHGIGNHHVYSALGSPSRPDGSVLSPNDTAPALVQPTTDVPPHEVWLLAWTRWSRSLNSLTWYLGLPFTLSNTAGEMSSKGASGLFTRAASTVVGLLLTMGGFFWSVNAVEAAMWKLRLPSHVVGVPTPEMLLLVVTGFWSVLLIRRAVGFRFSPPDLSPLGRALAVAHLATLWLAAVAVMRSRPARNPTTCVGEDSPFCLAWWSDWTVVLAWATVLLAVALVVVVAMGTLGGSSRTWAGAGTAPTLGASISLLVASVLLHAAGSVASLLVDWLMTYIQGLPPVRSRVAEAVPLLRAFDVPALLFTGRDTLAAVWVPIGWLLVVVLLLKLVWGWLRKHLVGPGALQTAAQRKAERRHRLIAEPGRIRFAVASLVALTVLIGLGLGMVSGLAQVQATVAQQQPLSTGLEVLRHTTVIGMHALVVLLPFALLSGDVRATIAVGSDVVGYWPIAHHPLAAPPYRFGTLRAAVADVDKLPRPLVIVGHSQGSVLAFALVGELARRSWAREDLALVTCGSPLSSLYSAYFPRHFPVEDRTKIASSVRIWTNFWRNTDPIATPLSPDAENADLAGPVDHEVPDGSRRTGEPTLRVHGDYWLETEQAAAVREAVAYPGAVAP